MASDLAATQDASLDATSVISTNATSGEASTLASKPTSITVAEIREQAAMLGLDLSELLPSGRGGRPSENAKAVALSRIQAARGAAGHDRLVTDTSVIESEASCHYPPEHAASASVEPVNFGVLEDPTPETFTPIIAGGSGTAVGPASIDLLRPSVGESAWSWARRIGGLASPTPAAVTDLEVERLVSEMGILAIHGAARVVLIGNVFLARKSNMTHGTWGPWLAAEPFGLSHRSATRYMWIARELEAQIGQIWPIWRPEMTMMELESILDSGVNDEDDAAVDMASAYGATTTTQNKAGAAKAGKKKRRKKASRKQPDSAVQGGEVGGAAQDALEAQDASPEQQATEKDVGLAGEGSSESSFDQAVGAIEHGPDEAEGADAEGDGEKAHSPAAEVVEVSDTHGADQVEDAQSPPAWTRVLSMADLGDEKPHMLILDLAQEADIQVWMSNDNDEDDVQSLGHLLRETFGRLAARDFEGAKEMWSSLYESIGNEIAAYTPMADE